MEAASKIMKLIMITVGVVVFDIFLLSPGFIGLQLLGGDPLQTASAAAILLASTLGLLFSTYRILMKPTVVKRPPLEQMKGPVDLERALQGYKGMKSLEQEIALALHQIERMRKKQETLLMVLNQRFEPTGLSFQKFASAIHEVEKLFFLNVRSMINRLHVFDEQEYQSVMSKSSSQLSSKLLQEKRNFYQTYLSFIQGALHMNEEILLKLDKLLLEISRLDSVEIRDIEKMSGMQEIDALIKQTHYYK
ncbi:hypothetical protein [Paenibacillus qinlingensis]|uniref:5-bromo-4-chloroindolyl phosphate hydrolysis protein n=1 Tax=Paenibacillus qinlingensis TaxID=1837343 RepID=A0ABU1P7N6_9BACL|nr:hypothetical protein [Paenibacillus qinlingensis]MDR6555197.1 hypothetical protein [Paenibacillus qinlingensis]